MIEIRHSDMDSGAATRLAYNQLYSDVGIQHKDSFYLWLLGLLKPQPGRRLLDISCGQGRLVRLAQERGLHAVGVDFSEVAVHKGWAGSSQSGWMVGDGERLGLPEACMDYVTHIGSLEHYQQPEAGVREIARVLRADGTACVLLPNTYGLFGNIQYVWQTGEVFDDSQPLQRYNTRGGWHRMLASNGLMPFRTLKYEREWPRTWADARWYLARPPKLVRLMIAGLVPLNLANCLVFLCHKAAAASRVSL